MTETLALWTLVLTTFYPAELSDMVTRPFGHFVTESLCYAAIEQIDATTAYAEDSSGGWILTCDPPGRIR